MLCRKWERVGLLGQTWCGKRKFLRSRWAYWEPWVDLRIYQAGAVGVEQRVEIKKRFRLRHRMALEWMWRLGVETKEIRFWRLDNPLMEETARVVLLKAMVRWNQTTGG